MSDKGVMTPTWAGSRTHCLLPHLALALSRGCGPLSQGKEEPMARLRHPEWVSSSPSVPRTGVPRPVGFSAWCPRLCSSDTVLRAGASPTPAASHPWDWDLGAVI